MREKVLLQARLPATQCDYEFWVPYDLEVGTAAGLMAQLLATRVGARFRPGTAARLMLLEGPRAGELLDGSCEVRALVCEGVLTNGSRVALW